MTEATEHKACKHRRMTVFLVPCPWQSGGRPAVLTATPPPLLTILLSCYLTSGNSFTTCTWTTINKVFMTTVDFGIAWVSSWTVYFREQDSFRLSLLPFLMPASGRVPGYKTALRNSQCHTVSYSRSEKEKVDFFHLGILLSTLWWPKWKGNLKKRGYMYMCNWFTLLYSRN